ncbi:MAG: hypothetical protein JST12_20250 [Armatimonadetes bacterium]|nr:hypothetical protein [Armatimonadota bacterium]
MAIVRGYHIRWAFTAAIIGIVAFVAYRQYYLWTPDGRFDRYLDFIARADRVELYATTDPWQGASNIDGQQSLSPTMSDRQRAVYGAMRAESRLEVPSVNRSRVVAFLQSLKAPRQDANTCSNPRHFVFATKGQKRVEVDICFSAGAMMLRGDLPEATISIQKSDPAKVAQEFGVDINPNLQRIENVLGPGS